MRKWVFVLSIGITSFLSQIGVEAASLSPSLKERWDAELAAPGTNLTEMLHTTLRDRHVVFVDGILNELAKPVGNYFTDNIRAVKALGVTYSHLRYSSRVSIPHNGEKLAKDLLQIHKEHQKPIILIGHSMGGAESLYSVLVEPQLMLQGIVDRVVLLNPAIGGSPLIENFKSNPLAHMIKSYLGEGFESLKPDVAHQNFSKVFKHFKREIKKNFGKDSKEILKYLSNRVFYVRGKHPTPSLSLGLDTVLFFCNKNLDEISNSEISNSNDKAQASCSNDGLLNTEDQMLNARIPFGVDLGILPVDHIELAVSGLFSHSNARHREAFTRAVFSAIYSDFDSSPNKLN